MVAHIHHGQLSSTSALLRDIQDLPIFNSQYQSPLQSQQKFLDQFNRVESLWSKQYDDDTLHTFSASARFQAKLSITSDEWKTTPFGEQITDELISLALRCLVRSHELREVTCSHPPPPECLDDSSKGYTHSTTSTRDPENAIGRPVELMRLSGALVSPEGERPKETLPQLLEQIIQHTHHLILRRVCVDWPYWIYVLLILIEVDNNLNVETWTTAIQDGVENFRVAFLTTSHLGSLASADIIPLDQKYARYKYGQLVRDETLRDEFNFLLTILRPPSGADPTLFSWRP